MKALKKLIPAAAMLLLCAAMMTTATFAWFGMNNNVSVDSITTTVTAPKNLQIGVTPESGEITWGNTVTVTGSAGVNGLNPVTTTTLALDEWKSTNKANMDGTSTGALSNLTLDATGKCTGATKGTASADPTKDDDASWQENQYFFTTYTVKLKNIGGTATDVYIDLSNTKISVNGASTDSVDLMKAVTFAAEATLDADSSVAGKNQFVQGDAITTAVTGYTLIGTAANSAVLVHLDAQAVATVKVTAWMEGTSKYCKISNVKNTTLKFDFALGFTTVAGSTVPTA